MRKKERYAISIVNPKQFMRLNEAAEFLGLSPRVLRAMVKSGGVPCHTFKNGSSDRSTYLFSRETLERWANGATN